jgi:glycosyltransferase involved in cell wall biosynthesis
MIETYHLGDIPAKAKFSILIPSWNNLELLKLCIRSIKKHSLFEHQIIVHVNEGKDGTLHWVKDQKELSYTYSAANVGVCFALNAMRSLVKTDYMVYCNDDMYLLPQWDKAFWEEISVQPSPLFFFSGTSLEPKNTNNNSVIAPADYGDSASSFQEEKLLKEYEEYNKQDWFGATWPPNIVATSTWDLVGGYSVEFSPGMYSDPDFSKKTLGHWCQEF